MMMYSHKNKSPAETEPPTTQYPINASCESTKDPTPDIIYVATTPRNLKRKSNDELGSSGKRCRADTLPSTMTSSSKQIQSHLKYTPLSQTSRPLTVAAPKKMGDIVSKMVKDFEDKADLCSSHQRPPISSRVNVRSKPIFVNMNPTFVSFPPKQSIPGPFPSLNWPVTSHDALSKTLTGNPRYWECCVCHHSKDNVYSFKDHMGSGLLCNNLICSHHCCHMCAVDSIGQRYEGRIDEGDADADDEFDTDDFPEQGSEEDDDWVDNESS